MGIEHLTRVMNNNTERGFTAHAHVHHLLSQYNHWPHEALESNPLKLPTLRILRLASTIPGLEYYRLPPLHHDSNLSTSIREASRAVDNSRQERHTTLQGQVGTKEYDKMVRQHCKLIQYSKNYSNTSPPSGNWGYTIRINSSQYSATPVKTTQYISNPPA
jgi:hypothetical protein